MLRDKRVNQLRPHAELFYRRLWNVVDDYGRYHAHPALLRSACFPRRVDEVREADISRWLAEVQSAGLLALYAIDGEAYLQLADFRQQIRAKESKFPDPPEDAQHLLSRCAADDAQTNSEVIADAHLVEIEIEGAVGDEDESGGGVRAACAPVMVFPCVGKPPEWGLLPAKMAEWEETYPGVDIEAICRQALQWCRDNPGKRKTAKGMTRFLGSWIGRTVDSGRAPRKVALTRYATEQEALEALRSGEDEEGQP